MGNRAQSLTKADGTYGVTYLYDGDGARVGQASATTATYYFAGGAYEVTAAVPSNTVTSTKKYYSLAGQMVAMDDGSGLKYFLQDHLGSVAAVLDASGTLLSEQRYLPFGQPRASTGPLTQTDFGYTGQRDLDNTGLMDYKARFYDSNSVTIVQESASIETKHPGYEVTKAVIMIPTMSMVDDPLRIQVGRPDPEKFQMIDIFAIQNDVGTIMAYIYSGRNKALNTEAQAVVDSIQQNCRKP